MGIIPSPDTLVKQSALKKSVASGKTGQPGSPVKSHSSSRLNFLICALLVLATAAVYFPVVTFDFINYDDPAYVTNNPHVISNLTWNNFGWAFSYGEIGHWHPLTWLSHMLDYQIYGLHAGGHHLTNVLLHTVSVILLFLVLMEMTGAVWRSAFVAAVFAIHPLRVESVAWVAERKDVLSGLFFMLTLLAYLRYVRKPPSIRRYLMVAILFALGLLSKGMLVTLPFVLLLLDYWPLQRLRLDPKDGSPMNSQGRQANVWRLIVEKIPLFALSAFSCLATSIVPEKMPASYTLSLSSRVGNALISYVTYLWQMVYSKGLATPYPYPANGPLLADVATVLALLLVISFGAVVCWRKRPYFAVGWLWYLGTLVPVIGLVQISYYSHADRYTYLPHIGVSVMVAWGVGELARRNRLRSLIVALAVVALIGCGVASALQVRLWRNSETLFTHSARVTTGNYIAFLNLGMDAMEKGKSDEAAKNFFEALRIRPDYPATQLAIANILRTQGQLTDAAAHYKEALRLLPDYEQAHYNYGSLLATQGNLDEAEKHFREALHLKPDWAEVQFKLGYLLCLRGNLDEGIARYQKAFKLRPEPEAHIHLGNAFARQKKWAEADDHLRLAVKALPNNPVAARDLAWVLAASGDPKIYNPAEAIQLAEHACELTERHDAGCLDILAIAYSESRRFDDAIKASEHAAQMAKDEGDTDLVAQIQERLKYFREGRTFRDQATKANP